MKIILLIFLVFTFSSMASAQFLEGVRQDDVVSNAQERDQMIQMQKDMNNRKLEMLKRLKEIQAKKEIETLNDNSKTN